jgi:DNA-binding LytR/AlgR family response regulator
MIYSSKKYKYLIVDSHLEDASTLQKELNKYPNFSCVGVARNKEDGVNLILDQLPHLVFFDTELVNGVNTDSAFGMIPEVYQFLNRLPRFVAMNSSTKHSYEAIKNGVFDYLLKPLYNFDLKKTLMRFENNQPENSSICIRSFAEFKLLEVQDILYLKADNNTTDFHLKDGSVITSYNTLKKYEQELPNIFARIHKSYMVNIKHINKIHFSKFHCSLKYTRELIPFSKSLRSKMLEIKDLWLNDTFLNVPQQISIT